MAGLLSISERRAVAAWKRTMRGIRKAEGALRSAGRSGKGRDARRER